VRQRTFKRHESIVRVHLIPSIGRVKLKALTPAHVRGLYREKLDAGLAPRSALHIHRTLSKALKQAVMDGLTPRNAAGPVKPPRPRRVEIRAMGREQVRVLFEAASGDRLEARVRPRRVRSPYSSRTPEPAGGAEDDDEGFYYGYESWEDSLR
jgi:hypothetical protein